MEDVKQQQQQITIKLRDNEDNNIDFRVRSNTKFIKVAKAYAAKRNADLNSIRFLKNNGDRLPATDEKTIEQLGLSDGDVLDVSVNQLGGGV